MRGWTWVADEGEPRPAMLPRSDFGFPVEEKEITKPPLLVCQSHNETQIRTMFS